LKGLKMSEKKSRAVVKFEDFIRVTVVERDKFDTAQKAANELGMKLTSFNQKLSAQRKEYPKVFESVPYYGHTKPSEDEALAILARLQAQAEPAQVGEPSEPSEASESSEAGE
jgi:hypothetical protein